MAMDNIKTIFGEFKVVPQNDEYNGIKVYDAEGNYCGYLDGLPIYADGRPLSENDYKNVIEECITTKELKFMNH